MDVLLVIQFQQANMTSEENAVIMLEQTDNKNIVFQDCFIVQVTCCPINYFPQILLSFI